MEYSDHFQPREQLGISDIDRHELIDRRSNLLQCKAGVMSHDRPLFPNVIVTEQLINQYNQYNVHQFFLALHCKDVLR